MGIIQGIKHVDHIVSLWDNYNTCYINDVQGNPRARAALQHDPGVKFMKNGWRIVSCILFIIYLIGVFSK